MAKGKSSADDVRTHVEISKSLYDDVLGRPANPGDANSVIDRAATIGENLRDGYMKPQYALRKNMASTPEGHAAIDKTLASLGMSLKPTPDKLRAKIIENLATGKSLDSVRSELAGNKAVTDPMATTFNNGFSRPISGPEMNAAIEAMRSGKSPSDVVREWSRIKKSGGSLENLFP